MQTAASHPGLCRDCDYPLRDLPVPRCPECGRPFDPADGSTMNLGKPMAPWARAVAADSGWPTYLAMLLPWAWVVWRARNPEFYYLEWFVFLILSFTLFAVLALVRSAAREIVLVKHDQPPPVRWWPDWRNCLLAGAALSLIVWFELPLRAHFFLVRAQLEEMKAALDTGTPPTSLTGRRVGMRRVVNVRTFPGGVMFSFTTNDDGFAYNDGWRSLPYNHGADGHLHGKWHWYASD